MSTPSSEGGERRLDVEVAIVGGGVIGLTAALRLAHSGREVLVIEPNVPGSGASWGNAGTIADYAVLPVGTPALLRNLPSLLLDRESPLSVRMAALPALAPWLLRFARESLPARMRANASALAGLLADAGALWNDLAAEIGASELLQKNGCLYLYESPGAFRAAESEIAFRQGLGLAQELLSSAELARLEPGLPPVAGGALLFPGAAHLADPDEVMGRLAAAATAAGVRFLPATVTRLERRGGRVKLTAGSSIVVAGKAVIAAGAHSRGLAAQAGDRVPLDTERGYHVEYDLEVSPVARPVSRTARGIYFVPMRGRLRAAGTVELGGTSAPPNPRRIALIDHAAHEFFPTLPSPDRSWLGFRPSMPTSVPVIRQSRGGNDVILAFGHGHLGLTLAPATARMLVDLI